jgi:predicted acyl esterase
VRLTGTDTGRSNRWRTQFGGDAVDYTAAAERMQSLPGFTTAPFATAKEVTGSPVLDLRLRLAAQPAQRPAVFAYLFAIDPAGRPHYLSEGQLMLRHRKAASGTTRLHTYRRRDALPVTSGEAMDVRIPLLPISALVPAGGRLKLLLASGDTPTFEVTPSYEASILPSSSLELPLAERRQDMCRSSRG